MSSYTSADVVPFKITVLHDGDRDRLPLNIRPSLKMFFDNLDDDNIPFTIHGWTYDSNVVKIGKRESLYGGELTKNNLKVFYINEDPYSAGGGETTTFVSKDYDALQEFCNDFGFNEPIKSDEIVLQTD